MQLYTGLVHEGPFLVRQIVHGLRQQLDMHGLDSIDQAVGQNLPFLTAPPLS